MNAIAALILASTVGVDYGWHRATDGEWEYIIQIEPGLVETLAKGQALVSQMPPELRGVRRFRIQIGQGEVPREPLPQGGLTTLSNAADPRSAMGGPTGTPLDPAAWGTGGYEFLRQTPIRLEPLENTFLNDPRLRVLDSGREAWDTTARAGTANSPWNPLSRPSWNATPGTFSNGPAFNAGQPIVPGPGTFASSALNGGGNVGLNGSANGGFNSGFGNATAADSVGFGIGPDPAPFAAPMSGGGRWGGESLLPERPRLEFETPEEAAESRRLRLNEPSGFPSRGLGGAFSGNAGNSGFGTLPRSSNGPGFQTFSPQGAGAFAGSSPVAPVMPGQSATAGPPSLPPNPPSAFPGSSWDANRGSGTLVRPPSISLAAPGRDSARDNYNSTGIDQGGFPNNRGTAGTSFGNASLDSGRTTSTNVAGNRPPARAEISRGASQPAAFVNSPTDKIWWPLTMTVLLLFGSLGGNFYLGWLAMDFYRRYRECAWQLRTGP
jgi:hypothetical protein